MAHHSITTKILFTLKYCGLLSAKVFIYGWVNNWFLNSLNIFIITFFFIFIVLTQKEKIFWRKKIFLVSRNFILLQENVFLPQTIFLSSKNFSSIKLFFLSSRKFILISSNFFSSQENVCFQFFMKKFFWSKYIFFALKHPYFLHILICF